MRILTCRALILACIFLPARPAAAVPPGPSTLGPRHVAILYNTNVPASREVARAYAEARGIPEDRMIGLDCPQKETITRAEYNDTIAMPLRRIFSEKQWWKPMRTPNGIEVQDSQIRVLVTVYGMPLRISRDAAASEGKEHPASINEASVDSELALLGAYSATIDGLLKNPYFRSIDDFARFRVKAMFGVSRLDGHSPEAATALARAGVAAEKAGGPWGRAMIDLSGTYPQGDNWLREIYSRSWEQGIPAQLDRHKWSFRRNFPVRDVAVYFGWYDGDASGFVADPAFRFRPGAVAAHIHSFSATSLRDPSKGWSAPLVAKGAAATVGNVYEPYLEMSHHMDVFFQALLDGRPLVEASLTSMPVLSWMTICLGDPLYRPFATRGDLERGRLAGRQNADYKAAALILRRLPDAKEAKQATARLREAAQSSGNPLFSEIAGLLEYRHENNADAMRDFDAAWRAYRNALDQARAGILLGEAMLARNRRRQALKHFRDLLAAHQGHPHAIAISDLLDQLDPPPPPPPAPPQGQGG